MYFSDGAYKRVVFRLNIQLFLSKHLDAGVNQEGAKDIDDPVKAIDQSGADKDHRQTHHERTQHAPEKNAMLELRRDLEIGKDQQEDEEIIDGE